MNKGHHDSGDYTWEGTMSNGKVQATLYDTRTPDERYAEKMSLLSDALTRLAIRVGEIEGKIEQVLSTLADWEGE